MNSVALKMLFGDRAKYFGIVMGIALASVIMIQQPGMLVSILTRTYSFISDVNLPDIWVMDATRRAAVGRRDGAQPIARADALQANATGKRKFWEQVRRGGADDDRQQVLVDWSHRQLASFRCRKDSSKYRGA